MAFVNRIQKRRVQQRKVRSILNSNNSKSSVSMLHFIDTRHFLLSCLALLLIATLNELRRKHFMARIYNAGPRDRILS